MIFEKRSLAIFILALTMMACQDKPQQQNHTIVLAGQLTNVTESKANIGATGFEQDITVNDDGTFSAKWEMEKSSYYTFRLGRLSATLYLNPGDSVHLTSDTGEFATTLQYSGNGAEKNNYLASYDLLNGKMGNPQKNFSREEADFLTFMDSARTVREEHLDKQAESIDDEDFITKEKIRFKYNDALEFSQYKYAHRYFAKKPDYEPSEAFNAYKSELDINDESLLDVPSYSSFLTDYVNSAAQDALKNDTTKDTGSMSAYLDGIFSAINNDITSLEVKEYLQQYYIYSNMTFVEPDALKDRIDEFKSASKNEAYITKIDEKYSQWSKLAKGSPAPGFSYVDMEGNKVSLADFKGKYVYIDTWATWCGPCKAELPYLEKIQEEFEGKNITFMSVSVDDSKEAWEKMVKEKEMKGVQLYADGAWNSSIIKDYMISGIPRFILVDTDGNLISPQASRPSGSLREDLEALPNI